MGKYEDHQCPECGCDVYKYLIKRDLKFGYNSNKDFYSINNQKNVKIIYCSNCDRLLDEPESIKQGKIVLQGE